MRPAHFTYYYRTPQSFARASEEPSGALCELSGAVVSSGIADPQEAHRSVRARTRQRKRREDESCKLRVGSV